MATTLTILVLALLITGVTTATVYALPIIQQTDAAQTQNGDLTQSQTRFQQRDCSQSGEMMQTRERLQLRECAQNCNGEGDFTGIQGDSDTTNDEAYQYQFCSQNCIRTQNRNRVGTEK